MAIGASGGKLQLARRRRDENSAARAMAAIVQTLALPRVDPIEHPPVLPLSTAIGLFLPQ